MAGMGFPPNPQTRRRRNAEPQLRKLPAKRIGPVPKWPLPFAPAEVELSLWRELWRLPVAVIWDQQHCGREVAQYVIWKVQAEGGAIEPAKEARQLGDRLGLTPMALYRMRYEVATDEVAERKADQPTTARRLKAVDVAVAQAN